MFVINSQQMMDLSPNILFALWFFGFGVADKIRYIFRRDKVFQIENNRNVTNWISSPNQVFFFEEAYLWLRKSAFSNPWIDQFSQKVW